MNIGILMSSKEVSSISHSLTKAKRFKRKLSHKTQSLLKNNSKPIHCLKSSPKNPALPNFKMTQLLPNLPSPKAPSNLSPKQLQTQFQTMQQAILYQPIHASKRPLTDFVLLWSIYSIYQANWTLNLTGKKP